MNPRFYSASPVEDSEVRLDGSEHQHMTKVMRLGVGQQVTLFDGSGVEFDATIVTVDRGCSRLRVDAKRAVDRELPSPISLAVALPKGDRQQWVVEKATELGVHSLIPLITDRGVAQPGPKALERMRKWIIGAAKQCGRNQLMQILEPQTPATLFSKEQPIVAHPQQANAPTVRSFLRGYRPSRRLTLAIGPEGGFSDAEVSLARESGCSLVDLGPRVLRIETAAVAMITLFSMALEHA